MVIKVEGLGKKYSLHHETNERYTALRDVVARQVRSAGLLLNPFTLAGQLRKSQRQVDENRANSEEEFWALKDVSFEIRRGERVGIIGRNGAGKSTLLKILSRITEPTTGRVEILGRVASLLEVGTGFHPELTGRENIYLNGAILGMTRREIRSKFDEIVDFAEVEKFLDTPVKRYSSGMYVRLAFAVAAYLEPEILVVDEVLAVGDASFQKKCLGKMRDVAGQGRTVLFVSHNMLAVRSLCSRAILLRKGQLANDGSAESVLHAYETKEHSQALHRKWTIPPFDETLVKGAIYLKEAKLQLNGSDPQLIRVDNSLELAFCIASRRSASISLSPHFIGPSGETVFATPSPAKILSTGETWFVCMVPANLLNDVTYSILLMIVEDGTTVLQSVSEVLVIEVQDVPRNGTWLGKWPGVVRPRFDWKIN